MKKELKHKKSNIPLYCLLGGALVLAGCGDSSPGQTEPEYQVEEAYDTTRETASDAAETTAETFSNAWDTVADFTAEQSDRLVTTLQGAYANLQDRVENLREEEGVTDEARENFRQAADAFNSQLERAGDASADAWDTARDNTREAWDNLVQAYEDLRAEAD